MVARESGGNPLFIDELVRHIQSGERTERWEEIGQLDLDEVLWDRTQWQPDDARKLLATVAVSGRPIRQGLAFQAAELGAGGRVALASLRSARLVRCIGQANDDVETYHDRIRETVVAHLPSEQLRWHHDRLAASARDLRPGRSRGPRRALQGRRRSTRAPREYFARGADQAAAALAFDHAAQLYKVALDLHSGTPAEARELGKKLGDALANAGRGRRRRRPRT